MEAIQRIHKCAQAAQWIWMQLRAAKLATGHNASKAGKIIEISSHLSVDG
jgi:hypothetical protein